MKEKTIVRMFNSLGCEIAVEYCDTDQEVRVAVLTMLDTLENGDSFTFEVITE